jgi:hypothetical protein
MIYTLLALCSVQTDNVLEQTIQRIPLRYWTDNQAAIGFGRLAY